MKDINYRSMLQNWDTIIDKLCDELTPYDVLGVVAKHLEVSCKMCENLGYRNDREKDALKKINEARSLINHERVIKH